MGFEGRSHSEIFPDTHMELNCPVTNSVVVFTYAKQHFNYLANPTVDEKCRKHPNKERYAFAKKSSLNKKISYDLATPMEVVPDENLSVEKQLPAMAKQPASVVVETIPTLPVSIVINVKLASFHIYLSKPIFVFIDNGEIDADG
ncbi:hypothetical protein OUZ56_018949 [Daphnia magna]|uniref:Uncharacterized protein n=1 Tax=Daphnia magna TaxID=35525 RepID=A0ABQ9ZA78_9CRUS|nr:hypothetical protein OUZ56_018949 [Daphnia magna]